MYILFFVVFSCWFNPFCPLIFIIPHLFHWFSQWFPMFSMGFRSDFPCFPWFSACFAAPRHLKGPAVGLPGREGLVRHQASQQGTLPRCHHGLMEARGYWQASEPPFLPLVVHFETSWRMRQLLVLDSGFKERASSFFSSFKMPRGWFERNIPAWSRYETTSSKIRVRRPFRPSSQIEVWQTNNSAMFDIPYLIAATIFLLALYPMNIWN